MELELKKTSLDVYETGGELNLTQEASAETIVPDYCPDIARIIKAEGKVFLHSRELRAGKAEVSGTVRVCVLYTPEGEGGIRALDFAYTTDGIVPFMKMFNTTTETISQGGSRLDLLAQMCSLHR